MPKQVRRCFTKAKGKQGELQTRFDATLGKHGLGGHGWTLKSSTLLLQHQDGSSCGVWIQVVRDAYLEYVDSSEFGSGAFLDYLERWLARQGVQHLGSLKGVQKTKAAGRASEGRGRASDESSGCPDVARAPPSANGVCQIQK